MPKDLDIIAKKVRKDILLMSYRAQSAHTGGALSCVEILVSLYFKVMKVYSHQPRHLNRDRFVFSKAHDAKALYAVLAQRGFFDENILKEYEVIDGRLPGHSTRNCIPGVEVSAGSLGHGLSMACGMALAAKKKRKNYKVFVLISDGECDEGSIWEAVLFAGHHQLDNLICIVDYNKLQGFGFTKDILDLEPLSDKWRAFGWETKEIDGHSFEEINSSLADLPIKGDKPSVIIAHTIKGKGGPERYVNQVSSQYKPPTRKDLKQILGSLVDL